MTDNGATRLWEAGRELIGKVIRRGMLVWVVGALLLRVADIAARLVGARILGPENQGVLEILVAWIATGTLLTSAGFSTSASIHVSDARDPDEQQTIFAVGTLGILAGCLAVGVGGLIVFLTTSWIPPAVAPYGLLVMAIIVLAGFGDPRFGLFGLIGMGLKQYAMVGRQRLLVATLYFGGWVIGAWLAGVRGALIGWAVAVLVGALYALRGLPLQLRFAVTARVRARKVCWHAWQCLGNQISSRFNEYLAVLLLVLYSLPKEDIGNFGVSLAGARILLVVPAMLGSLSLPYLVSIHRDRPAHLRLSRMLFWLTVGIALASWLGLSVAGRWLLPDLLPRFAEAQALFQILVLACLFDAFCLSLGTRFLSLHLPAKNLIVNVLSVVALPILAVVLIPHFGVYGMAYAWCFLSGSRVLAVLGLTLHERHASAAADGDDEALIDFGEN